MKMKNTLLIGCVLILTGLFLGTPVFCADKSGEKENGVVENHVFVRTASPAFRFPIPHQFRVQKPKFKEIFRALNPKTRLPITISIYDLKTGQSTDAEFESLRKKVMGTIMKLGFCSRLALKPVETVADYNGFPAYSFDFDCKLKRGSGSIKTNLLAIVKNNQFVSFFAMSFSDINKIKKDLKSISL